MGERLLCKQEVIGSIPFTSTKLGCKVTANFERAPPAQWAPGAGIRWCFSSGLITEFSHPAARSRPDDGKKVDRPRQRGLGRGLDALAVRAVWHCGYVLLDESW